MIFLLRVTQLYFEDKTGNIWMGFAEVLIITWSECLTNNYWFISHYLRWDRIFTDGEQRHREG